MEKGKVEYVTVYYMNGKKTETSVNPNLTDKEIKDYWKKGTKVNIGVYPKEEVTRVKRVVIHRKK